MPEIAPTATSYSAPGLDKSTGSVSTRLTIGGHSLPEQGSLNVAPAEPSTVLLNIPWTTNATYSSVVSNVLFRKTLGKVDYWVCYGAPGNSGEVVLNRGNSGKTSTQSTYPTDESIKEVDLDSGDGSQAKFLIINTSFTDKTWLVNDAIYFGPSFVLENGSMEFPEASGGKATLYTENGKSEVSQPPATESELPVLANWSWRDAASERTGNFKSPGWVQSQGPQQMGLYDSYQNSYAWYGTVLHSDTGNPIALQLNGVNTQLKFGTFETFLNGEPADLKHLPVKAGDNVLSILAKASRQPKGYNFAGAVLSQDKDPQKNPWRGIWGSVLQDGQPSSLSTAPWYFHPGLDDLQETAIIGRVLNWPEFLNHSPWQSGQPTTPNLPTFWKTTFTYQSKPGIKETLGLRIPKGGPIKSGNIWLNGHNIGEVPQNEPIYMPECWIGDGANDLVVFDMFGRSPQNIQVMRYDGFSLNK